MTSSDMKEKIEFLNHFYKKKCASNTFSGQESKSKALQFMLNSGLRSIDDMHHFSTVQEEKIAQSVFWAMDTYRERKQFLLDIYNLRYECKGRAGRLLGTSLCQLSQASWYVPDGPSPEEQ